MRPKTRPTTGVRTKKTIEPSSTTSDSIAGSLMSRIPHFVPQRASVQPSDQRRKPKKASVTSLKKITSLGMWLRT